MCDCIERVNKALGEQGRALRTVSTTSFVTGETKCIGLEIATDWIKPSRKKQNILMPTFCPFCGVKVQYGGKETTQ